MGVGSIRLTTGGDIWGVTANGHRECYHFGDVWEVTGGGRGELPLGLMYKGVIACGYWESYHWG